MDPKQYSQSLRRVGPQTVLTMRQTLLEFRPSLLEFRASLLEFRELIRISPKLIRISRKLNTISRWQEEMRTCSCHHVKNSPILIRVYSVLNIFRGAPKYNKANQLPCNSPNLAWQTCITQQWFGELHDQVVCLNIFRGAPKYIKGFFNF